MISEGLYFLALASRDGFSEGEIVYYITGTQPSVMNLSEMETIWLPSAASYGGITLNH
jgi:hypothetical protein